MPLNNPLNLIKLYQLQQFNYNYRLFNKPYYYFIKANYKFKYRKKKGALAALSLKD